MTGTIGVINGSLFLFYIDNVAIGSATSHSLSVQAATRNTTTKSSAGWETNLAGLRSWSATGSGLVVFADAYGLSQLMAAITARTPVTVRLSTEVTGDKFFQGSANLTDISVDAPSEENTTYSFTFKGSGPLTELSQT